MIALAVIVGGVLAYAVILFVLSLAGSIVDADEEPKP